MTRLEAIEMKLQTIAASVARRERVDLDADWSDAGIDSLKQVRLVLEIERAFDLDIPLVLMSVTPNARSLAVWLSRNVAHG